MGGTLSAAKLHLNIKEQSVFPGTHREPKKCPYAGRWL